jgi:hypothetical protein
VREFGTRRLELVRSTIHNVMAGLVPAIHALLAAPPQDVDARDKRGHDD